MASQQKPMDGVSFLSTFDSANAKPVRTSASTSRSSAIARSTTTAGWRRAQHTFPWRQDFAPGNWDKDKWELYNLDEDFSQANDLAATNPKKLAEMKALFDERGEEEPRLSAR